MKTLFCAVSFVTLLFLNDSLWAQSDQEITERSSFKDRVFVGGNLGLQFGDITVIDVSPLLGYRLTNRTSAGVGFTYQYFKFDYGLGREATSNIYGPRIFGRHNINQQLFLHGEFESLNLELYNPADDRLEREWVSGLLLGGGYFVPIGRRAGFNLTVLYNVLYDDQRSPYNSPLVVRAGATLGLGR